MNTLLRTLHCNLYHTIIDVKKHVNKQKRQRGPEEQGNPLPISEVKSQLLNLLDSFHITVQNGGTLVIDGGILANALINLSSSSHVRIVNGGTIYMRKNRYFSAPVGCVVEIENGEIRGPYIKKSAKWN